MVANYFNKIVKFAKRHFLPERVSQSITQMFIINCGHLLVEFVIKRIKQKPPRRFMKKNTALRVALFIVKFVDKTMFLEDNWSFM